MHYEGSGVSNAVWCETAHARWTQSAGEVSVIVTRKPAAVGAAELEVSETDVRCPDRLRV